MALEFFKNNIKVETDKSAYSRGDIIRCICTLEFEKPIDARELKAILYRIRRYKGVRYIYVAQTQIGSARTYHNGERFEFSFPVDEKTARDLIKFSGITGWLQSSEPKSDEFLVQVLINLPLKLDISGATQITVNRPIVQK